MGHIQERNSRLGQRKHLVAFVADSESGKMPYLPVQDLDSVFVYPVAAAVSDRKNLSVGCCKTNRQPLLWPVPVLQLLRFLLIV